MRKVHTPEDYEQLSRSGSKGRSPDLNEEDWGRVRGKGSNGEEDDSNLYAHNHRREPPEKPPDKHALPGPPTGPGQAKETTEWKDAWVVRRGHSLSYIGLFVFTIILYFRPYDLIPALSGFSSMAFWVAILTLLVFFPAQLALEGNLTARPLEVNMVLLLVLAGLLSTPFAIDRNLAWETFTGNFIKATLMFIVMVNVVRTERRWKWIVFLALAVCVTLSVWALQDHFGGRATVEGYRIEGRIDGLFRNPNELALNIVIVAPIAMALLLSARSLIVKIIYGACTVLLIGGIVVTYSRGGFLGLVAASGVFIWKIRRRHKSLALVLALVGVLTLPILVPGGYMGRMLSIVDHARDIRGSASTRQNVLLLSIKVALRHPLLGIGMRNFEIVSIQGLVTHNAYTQVATEMGIPALIAFLAFLVYPFKRLGRIERELSLLPGEKKLYYTAIGLQAALVGYMVTAFFISSAFQWYTYYLVGYAVCFRRLYETRAKSVVSEQISDRKELGSRAPEPSGSSVLGLENQIPV